MACYGDSFTLFSLESFKISKEIDSSSATHQIKKTDGRWACNKLEKANTFAQHLEK
jgi:hypothetical protein